MNLFASFCISCVVLAISLAALGQQRDAGPFTQNNRDHSNENLVIFPVDSLNDKYARVLPYGGETPTPRVFSAVAAVKNFFIVFGGYSTDGTPMDDVNIYDLDSHLWSGPILKRECCNYDHEVIETLGADSKVIQNAPFIRHGFEGDLPAARAEHTATSVGDEVMLVFGGYTSYFNYVQDLYSFDPVALNWQKISKTTGGLPARRAGHSAVGYSNGLYLFGGRTTGEVGLNDVWRFDRRVNKWEFLQSSSINQPIPRQHAGMSIVNQKIFIFGGIVPDTKVILDDFWSFDVASRVWTCHSALGSNSLGFGPPPLYRPHLVSINPTGILIYGGFGGGGSCGGDACDSLESTLGQTYIFHFDQKKWTQSKLYSGSSDSEQEYLSNTMWQYSRITAAGTYKGRLRKRFAFEEVFFLPERNMMVEFGGLQAVDMLLSTANQTAQQGLYPGQPISMDSGKPLKDVNWDPKTNWNLKTQHMDSVGLIHPQQDVLWDLNTGEHDRTRVDLLTNGYWDFVTAFTQSQPQLNFTKVKFFNCLRYYTISDFNIIHVHTLYNREKY